MHIKWKATHYPNFSNITCSRGSVFLNKLVIRELAGCTYYINGERNCLREIELGLESCGARSTPTGPLYECEYEIQEKLQVVEIYFDTPTFDKITRDAKTNNIAKLSMIGGTLGLLTGK